MGRANLTARRPSLPDPDVLDALGLGFARAAQTSSTGFALVDAAGRARWTTAAFARLVRLKGAATDVDLVAHLDGAFRLAAGEAAATLARPRAGTLELHEGRDGAPVLLHLAAHAPGDETRVAVAVAADPARVRAAGGAPDAARTDPLTRLGNARLLDERLRAWVPGASGADGSAPDASAPDASAPNSIALVALRLHPRDAASALPRDAHDELVALAADRLRGACRAEDTLARTGDASFAILHACGTDGLTAETVATRALELLARPFALARGPATGIASAGIAVLDPDEGAARDLPARAGLALEEAVRDGGGTWRRFGPALERRARLARQDTSR